ncbi:MAG: hypothetical protein PHS59_06245 [Paludibacter sp.]|nr:hypothetical protein [Paludibacter sp.]
MKRTYLFLILSVFVFNLSSKESSTGQGIAYYKAGFPQVAKSLLFNEYSSDILNRTEICYYLGNIYFEENQLDSASYYFNKGFNVEPLNSFNVIGNSMIKMKYALASAETDIKRILKIKGNNKNENVMIAISRAYLMNSLTVKALDYCELAKDINPKSSSVAVLFGDIKLEQQDLGEACSNYELAILYDENCKEAYIKYARAYKNVNPKLSIEMLNRLKQKDPAFLLVDKELADIYYVQNNFDEAAKLYNSYLQSGNSSIQDLTKYAMTLFLNNDFSKSLEVAQLGLQKAPRNPAFNRLVMWNNVDLKKYGDALKAADLFFNQTDHPDFTYLDYRYYGQALRETKQFDLSILQFQTALKMDSSKIELWKDISDMYNDKADYLNSITAYTQYLKKLDESKKTCDVIIALGKLYYSLGNNSSTDPLIKKRALSEADSIFAIVAVKEPTGYRGNFWRARANAALDPETLLGLAKPYYDQTVSLVESKADPKYNSVLIECYSYLGYYSLLQKNNTLSLSYWDKIIAIDPSNSTAKKAIDGIQKALKGKI